MAVRYGRPTERLSFFQKVWYADTVRLFCNGTGTVRFKNLTEVRFAVTVRFKVRGRLRSTQILNVAYRTVLPSLVVIECYFLTKY